ncbi:hypothetical protein [Novosphingobium album (ex Liu et al. 2023)]|uniref:Uncharacterized protein n=1 Tax=Novosphingobium album (ex Liu et al. 2023) TaxID=3031130 RepID=A0ABT5WR15_9SPHN|nr:hypothetical protein [Novosphingobium album (ex Liu et al. 2023)]MDE8651433.1 hypothetical protein [Novosphingobium album (ex Liu et al. 2023)]
MSSAYTKSLQRSIDADLSTKQQLSNSPLEARFIQWLDSQPEISRIRPYSMIELERALNTQGRYISSILLRHGWQRRRKWSSRGQYHRYWMPPGIGR